MPSGADRAIEVAAVNVDDDDDTGVDDNNPLLLVVLLLLMMLLLLWLNEESAVDAMLNDADARRLGVSERRKVNN